MEGANNSLSSGRVTVVGSEAPSDYHVAVAPRTTKENPTQATGSPPPATVEKNPTPFSVTRPPPPAVRAGGIVFGSAPALKNKRGRPRKYGPDGDVNRALSPKPILSSAPPPVIDFSAVAKVNGGTVGPATLPAKLPEPLGVEYDDLGESVRVNFTPHIINVNTGEDVAMKIISFSQGAARAICILSANGAISSVTLRQADSSGGTMTYEGRFEIVSLTGSFVPSETGGIRNRSGGMSVSLASPDGRVVGGGVAGFLLAATPVQIVVASFLAGGEVEQKQKTKKHMPEAAAAIIPASNNAAKEGTDYTSPSFHGDSWSSIPPHSRTKPADNILVFNS